MNLDTLIYHGLAHDAILTVSTIPGGMHWGMLGGFQLPSFWQTLVASPTRRKVSLQVYTASDIAVVPL